MDHRQYRAPSRMRWSKPWRSLINDRLSFHFQIQSNSQSALSKTLFSILAAWSFLRLALPSPNNNTKTLRCTQARGITCTSSQVRRYTFISYAFPYQLLLSSTPNLYSTTLSVVRSGLGGDFGPSVAGHRQYGWGLVARIGHCFDWWRNRTRVAIPTYWTKYVVEVLSSRRHQ